MHKGLMAGKGVESNFADETLLADSVTIVMAAVGSMLLVWRCSWRYYYVEPSIPQAAELRDIKVQVPLQVYSRDGRLIDGVRRDEAGSGLLRRYSPLLIKAVLATETSTLRAPRHRIIAAVIRGFIAELRGGKCWRQHDHATGSANLDVMKRAGLNSASGGSSRSTRNGSSRLHGAGVPKEEISRST